MDAIASGEHLRSLAVKLLQALKAQHNVSLPKNGFYVTIPKSSSLQFIIAGKILEGLVFFLSNGDNYDHLKPLNRFLRSHLDTRNGHAHDGAFLASFVPNVQMKSSSSDSFEFAKSVDDFMKDIQLRNNGFEITLKNHPSLDENDLPTIYSSLVDKVGKLYCANVDDKFDETSRSAYIHDYMKTRGGFDQLQYVFST